MTLIDALTITGLGMAVVFCGLILTSLLILAFGSLPSLSKRYEKSAPSADKSPVVSPAPNDPGVIAVITTILEVERRLHHAEAAGRLTIKRSS